MSRKKVLSALILSALILSNTTGDVFLCGAIAANNNYPVASSSQQLKGQVITIPAGTSIPAMTTYELNSENLSLGQGVTINLPQNFYYGNNLVAPAGSVLNGNVISVKKAKRGGINGNLKVRFTNIVTPTGQMIPISGMIQTDDGTGLLKGGTAKDTTKAYAKDIAVGSAAGALAGVIISPLAGGEIGKGTALATAVGAGGGLVKSVWDKGINAVIPAGTQVNIVIDQPITYTPASRY